MFSLTTKKTSIFYKLSNVEIFSKRELSRFVEKDEYAKYLVRCFDFFSSFNSFIINLLDFKHFDKMHTRDDF